MSTSVPGIHVRTMARQVAGLIREYNEDLNAGLLSFAGYKSGRCGPIRGFFCRELEIGPNIGPFWPDSVGRGIPKRQRNFPHHKTCENHQRPVRMARSSAGSSYTGGGMLALQRRPVCSR